MGLKDIRMLHARREVSPRSDAEHGERHIVLVAEAVFPNDPCPWYGKLMTIRRNTHCRWKSNISVMLHTEAATSAKRRDRLIQSARRSDHF